MYNFSGLIYRIWGVCGIILLLGIIIVLFEKPWRKTFKSKSCKIGIFLIAFGVFTGSVYAYRICFPKVSSYTGRFIESYRTSSAAPPLPFTSRYVFWDGEGKKKGFYLDVFSKKEIFPFDFEEGEEYIVFYDRSTKIIVKIIEVNQTESCDRGTE